MRDANEHEIRTVVGGVGWYCALKLVRPLYFSCLNGQWGNDLPGSKKNLPCQRDNPSYSFYGPQDILTEADSLYACYGLS